MKDRDVKKIMEYEKCLVELDEIFKYLKNEALIKIPYETRKAISEKKDKQYNWKYDESKPLNKQNLKRETIAMLSYLNMEYLLDKNKKAIMEDIHKFNEEKIEKEKRKKYDPNNIFKENVPSTENDENKIEKNKDCSNKEMIVAKEDKWYKKIINAIAKLFHKK